MNSFNFKIPQTVEFGVGSLNKLPQILKDSKSDHVFLISDKGLESLGVVKKIQDIVEAGGLKCTCYTDVLPNPTVNIVHDAAAKLKASGATSIIALGGGSPMDVAKAAGVVATYGGKVTDYEGPNKVPGPIVPTIAIPTTAGTGSEVTASSVITDEERNFKFSVLSFEMIPAYAILDPELILGMPAHIAAACGIDALIHAAEAYVSTQASPFSDSMAEKGMELIGRSIRKFVADRRDIDAACDMLLGSNFAGIAFAWARLGNVHAMSHPISAFYHVPHGVANAVIFPTVLEFNQLADKGRYEKIYNYISKVPSDAYFTPDMLVKEARALNEELGIPATFTEMGLKEEDIPQLALDTHKSGNVHSNPRQSTPKDIEALFRKLL